jgi:hypothetical protein
MKKVLFFLLFFLSSSSHFPVGDFTYSVRYLRFYVGIFGLVASIVAIIVTAALGAYESVCSFPFPSLFFSQLLHSSVDFLSFNRRFSYGQYCSSSSQSS